MTDSHREASWAALHRPNTSRQEIEAIVARYPEFAEAGTAHPNGGPIDPTVAAAARGDVIWRHTRRTATGLAIPSDPAAWRRRTDAHR